MLTIKDYQLLVLRGFDALRREINEAEQYTVQQYNQAVEQEKAIAAKSVEPKQTKTTTTETKKVTK